MTASEPCVAFVDLDDTLFSSKRGLSIDQTLAPAAMLIDGSVISYTNPVQRVLYRMLTDAALVVPVTARNIAALRRVLLPFDGAAVCSHGATILNPDGTIDTEWREQIAGQLAAARDLLVDFVSLAGRLPDRHGRSLRSWLVHDDSDPAYAVVKHPSHDVHVLLAFAETTAADWLRDHPGFRMHVNGNNLAILPPGVGKALAVSHLITEFRRRGFVGPILGAADSNTDLEFLDLCDMLLLPGRSQLADSLRRGVAEQEKSRA